jgi:hypothetical protein
VSTQLARPIKHGPDSAASPERIRRLCSRRQLSGPGRVQPQSLMRLRAWSFDEAERIDAACFERRITQALAICALRPSTFAAGRVLGLRNRPANVGKQSVSSRSSPTATFGDESDRTTAVVDHDHRGSTRRGHPTCQSHRAKADRRSAALSAGAAKPAKGVHRDKAALSSGCAFHLAIAPAGSNWNIHKSLRSSTWMCVRADSDQ